MADRIVAAVRLKRKVLEGVEQQLDIVDIMLAHTRKVLFTRPGPETIKLRNELIRVMRQKYFPLAETSGRKSAAPILDRIGGAAAVEAGSTITGSNLQVFTNYTRNNTRWMAETFNSGTKALSSELEAEIARAARDRIANATLRQDVIDSYRAELKQIKRARIRLSKENIKVANAEATGNLKLIRAAKAERAKALASTRRVTTAMGRLENRVQGAARDAVRRQAQQAQLASYKQAGFRIYTWVAVNGSDGCVDCQSLHGSTRTLLAWNGLMPGDGQTVCADSCVCELVPEQFTVDNKSIAGPVNPFLFDALP